MAAAPTASRRLIPFADFSESRVTGVVQRRGVVVQ